MDPIADLLIRIKNAQKVGQLVVKIPFSRIKFDLAKILEKEGFILSVAKSGSGVDETILTTLKYEQGMPMIHEMKKISKPGLRVYRGYDKLRSLKGGYGITVISTSRGLMTAKEAKKQKTGGEVLCEVW